MSAQPGVHLRGKFNFQFSPSPTNMQLNLGKLLIIEWKIKLVFAIQVLVLIKLIFQNVLQFQDEQ